MSVTRLVAPLREVAGRGHDVPLWPVLAGFGQLVEARRLRDLLTP